jgi:hypothetical protein
VGWNSVVCIHQRGVVVAKIHQRGVVVHTCHVYWCTAEQEEP